MPTLPPTCCASSTLRAASPPGASASASRAAASACSCTAAQLNACQGEKAEAREGETVRSARERRPPEEGARGEHIGPHVCASTFLFSAASSTGHVRQKKRQQQGTASHSIWRHTFPSSAASSRGCLPAKQQPQQAQPGTQQAQHLAAHLLHLLRLAPPRLDALQRRDALVQLRVLRLHGFVLLADLQQRYRLSFNSVAASTRVRNIQMPVAMRRHGTLMKAQQHSKGGGRSCGAPSPAAHPRPSAAGARGSAAGCT